jgi:hypothetical protein
MQGAQHAGGPCWSCRSRRGTADFGWSPWPGDDDIYARITDVEIEPCDDDLDYQVAEVSTPLEGCDILTVLQVNLLAATLGDALDFALCLQWAAREQLVTTQVGQVVCERATAPGNGSPGAVTRTRPGALCPARSPERWSPTQGARGKHPATDYQGTPTTLPALQRRSGHRAAELADTTARLCA